MSTRATRSWPVRRVVLPVALAGLAILSSSGRLLAQSRPVPARGAAASTAAYDRIAPLVEAAIAEHKLPGAVVLIGRGDEILYERAFGQRALQPLAEPMTPDTVFDAASLTKVVATTTAVMQLVEQGRLRLTDRVAVYVPGFERYGKNPITIRHSADPHVRAASGPRARGRVRRLRRGHRPRGGRGPDVATGHEVRL